MNKLKEVHENLNQQIAHKKSRCDILYEAISDRLELSLRDYYNQLDKISSDLLLHHNNLKLIKKLVRR